MRGLLCIIRTFSDYVLKPLYEFSSLAPRLTTLLYHIGAYFQFKIEAKVLPWHYMPTFPANGE
jgi:hypothetical protein